MSRSILPILLAFGLLLGGHALVSRAQTPSGAQVPLVLWIENRSGQNLLMAAPADALESPHTLTTLPSGAVLESSLAPRGGQMALVTAENQAETLWLLDLHTYQVRRVEQAASLGKLQWHSDSLAYTAYLPRGVTSQRGKNATTLQPAWQATRRWTGTHAPAPQPALVARRGQLWWEDPQSGFRRLIAPAGTGFSALWQPQYNEVLFTQQESRRIRLLRLQPRDGHAQTLGYLPLGNWRLLDHIGTWVAAEWYPHGVQVFSLEQGQRYPLGESRRFVGFWQPEVPISPPQGHAASPFGETASPLSVSGSCPAPPDNCPVPRFSGYQPRRVEMGATFVQAAQNTLGSAAPTYEGIFTGRPPVRQSVSPQRPLPQVLLRGIAWQESVWLQYLAAGPPYDGVNACTLISFDCGYGLMQVTSCMSGGCNWLDPQRVSAELPYNLGAGVNILIQKWNSVPYLGENDPTTPAEWYYAVLAYNGWSTLNDPNNSDRFDPFRPPFRESSLPYRYPYQEKVYGWMAHPPHVGGEALWRPTDIPPVPRGIFGLRSASSWTPPHETTRPLTHLFHNLRYTPSRTLTLTVQNTTPYTLALDVLFYNADGSFNRRYLPPSAQPPWFVEPYLRVAPSGTFTLPLQSVFFTETFTGYLRAYASSGLSLTLETPTTPTIYLPLVMHDAPTRTLPTVSCTQVLTNGGFEAFADGRPRGWVSHSAGGYVLADSTWFWQGHAGGYLGGYNHAQDVLTHTLAVPTDTFTVTLSLFWDVQSEALTPTLTGDVFTATLVDAAGAPIGAPWVLHETEASGGWRGHTVTWPLGEQRPAALVFTARTDAADPTSFFVDEVRLQACKP